jgi:hypothetical protein
MLAKAGLGGLAQNGADGGVRRHRQFTPADLDEARGILSRAVADKKLDILDAARAETQINKSISNPAFQIDQSFLNILNAENK